MLKINVFFFTSKWRDHPALLLLLLLLVQHHTSTTVHHIHLCHDQVKVGVEEVRDADSPILVPTEEVQLMRQTLDTFVAWPTHLVKRLSEQGDVGLAKPPNRLDHDVDDPLYLMTLTIPQLFLKPLQVMWGAIVFGVFNDNFPLYIKHEDLAHCQMVVILPKENVVIWFCSLHNRPNNYLKGIINKSVLFFNTFALALVGNINILIVQYTSMFVLNNALKGLDDTPQSKSKAAAR
ncbi:hypothetical protein GmHk_03G007523 [Glycine max]|nr:hypothetical protein GmHk_03G007523 [Glycine max]